MVLTPFDIYFTASQKYITFRNFPLYSLNHIFYLTISLIFNSFPQLRYFPVHAAMFPAQEYQNA